MQAPVEVLSAGGGGADGLLHVQVLVADARTVEAVQEAAEPWLAADQVVVSGALRPLED